MILFTDAHLHLFSPVMGNGYLKVGIDCFKQVRKYAIATGDKTVIFLGDVFQLKDRIPTKVWNAFLAELKVWEKEGIKSYWLLGNHDFQTDTNIENFDIFDLATPLTEITTLAIEGHTCLFVPYGSTPEAGEDIRPDTDFVFAHDFFAGVDYGFPVEGGLDIKLFDMATYIFCGHVHKHMEIQKGRTWHIGSTFQTNFGEVGQDKYFVHLSDDLEKPKFIPFDFPRLEQFEEGDEVPDVAGKYVKFKANLKSLGSIQDIKNDFMEKGALGVQIEALPSPEQKKRLALNKDKAVLTDQDYLKAFIEHDDNLPDKEKSYSILTGEGIIKLCN